MKINKNLQLKVIGRIQVKADEYFIRLADEYVPGLKHIDGFSHLVVVWWGHLTDSPEERDRLITRNLFKKAPENVGVFASRTPVRPNPIMISTIKVSDIDFDRGIIHTPFIDAETETPVLDIKPYFPMERIRDCKTPGWFEHWPQWAEDAAGFNWQDEINFP